MKENTQLPVIVIGAGPIGLSAAVHLLDRGETPLVFEAGAQIASSIRKWGHVRMFSPWEITMDKPAIALLQEHGWQSPPLNDLPTGQDLIEQYLEPLADIPAINQSLRLNSKVVGISRLRKDKMKDYERDSAPFIVQVQQADGEEYTVEAKAVIDASGTWTNPNPIGSNGLLASGERKFADRVYYGIPDVHGRDNARFVGKRVAVVGGGHSAINALLELADVREDHPEMEIYWILRKPTVESAYGGTDDDALPARGQLGIRIKALVDSNSVNVMTPFHISRLQDDNGAICVSGDTPDGEVRIVVDEIVATTGFRPNLDMLREVRIELDPAVEATPALAPMIDPNIHSCGTVRPHGEAELRHPEKNFYIVGMKSYGRAPTFLLATGYEQVRSVVAALVGDWEAAQDVQLNLPETGVCNTDRVYADASIALNGEVKIADISLGVKSSQPQSGCCS